MTGSTREQCFFICWGSSANGNSTLIEVLRHVLGDYAQTSSSDTFLQARDSRGPDNDVARLRGARLAAVESGEGRRLDEERIKRLTGGDTITARLLYREHFEFSPQFKIWLAVNDRPEIRGIDHGIWRRVRLIPFTVTIPPEQQDRDLTAKLQQEAAGILRWAVEGCLAWQRDGLQAPDAVAVATEHWRADANIVAQFVADCCTTSPPPRSPPAPCTPSSSPGAATKASKRCQRKASAAALRRWASRAAAPAEPGCGAA